MRGPLARMLGLIHKENLLEELVQMLKLLRLTSEEMDLVIREMNDTLNKSAYKIIEKNRKNDLHIS
ncbi:MAG: hypothetical protein ACLFQO_07620 [Cyclobacteriaceae bacterium]